MFICLFFFLEFLADMLARGIIIIEIRAIQFCMNITINNPIKRVSESLNNVSMALLKRAVICKTS